MIEPELFAAYVPQDRRLAMARGDALSERTHGAVLFADISGFTPLTEALSRHLGPQRGAEELTGHLDRVYAALNQQLHSYRGSVVGYSGDAITAWFDGDDGRMAIAAALGMQAAMRQLAAVRVQSDETVSLVVKVAVITGAARRLLVGDPAIQVIDVVAGAIAERLGVAAQLVRSGEVLVDAGTARHLARLVQAGEQRQSPSRAEAFAVVTGLTAPVDPMPWPPVPPTALADDQLRPWILPAVYERLCQGHSLFLTELRPTVAIFLRFAGIDYEQDPAAGDRLDAYIRWVQRVLARYEGNLLQVSFGEKGSYLYGTFGAPVTHEDDSRRAVMAAVELLAPPAELGFMQPVSIGISRGTMRTGPMGSSERRAYAVMGDEANVAARLMEAAMPGEIIASERVAQQVIGSVRTRALPPLKVKGKTQPLPVFRLEGVTERPQRVGRLQTAQIVGRAAERELLSARLAALGDGECGVLVIEGEAGIGKSRLVAEWLEATGPRPVRTLAGAGDSIEQGTPYYTWRNVFRQLLRWDQLPASLEARQGHVLAQLATLGLGERAPLLNAVLPLELPDNDLTAEMSGKVRAENTHAVLVALLQQAASEQPVRVVLEDAHWLDSASWALALAVLRQVEPLLLVLVTRPLPAPLAPDYEQLLGRPDAIRMRLEGLSPDDGVRLACLRLGVAALPEPVAALIREKAEGHPFFSEELAYALRDSGVITITDGECRITPGVDVEQLVLPDTVEGVVTGRIDRLTAGQQLTMKVASVIGRAFALRVLEGVHPVETDRSQLPEILEQLHHLDLTPMATPAPELSYVFKHIITQEAAYNLLLYAQRRQLHRAVAEWYENTFAGDLAPLYPLLAHHWLIASEQSPDDNATLNAIEYQEKAGEAALRSDANREAVRYFSKLLELAAAEGAPVGEHDGPASRAPAFRLAQWHQQLGEAYSRLGQLVESEQHFARSLAYLGLPLPNGSAQLVAGLLNQVVRQTGGRLRRVGQTANPALASREVEIRRLACRIYERLGLLYFLKNATALMVYCPLASLNLAEAIGPSPELAIAYSYVTGAAGLVPAPRLADMYERLALRTAEQVGYPLVAARVLMGVSVYTAGVGRFEDTERRLGQAIAAFEVGGSWEWWGVCMDMLTRVKHYQGQFRQAADTAERLYGVAKRRGDVVQQSWSLSSRMEALMQLGEGDEAMAQSAELARLVQESHESGPQQKRYGVSALVHLQRQEWTAAEASAKNLLALIAGERPTSFGLLSVYSAVADTYLALWERQALADLDGVKRQAATACKLLERCAQILPIAQPAWRRAAGLHAWLIGRPGQAQSHWRAGLERAQALGMPIEEALAYFELGRHLAPDAPQRAETLAKARQLLQPLHAGYYQQQVQDALPGTPAQ